MKTSDIQIGTAYAVCEKWAYDPRYAHTRIAHTHRVVALETGLSHRTGHTAALTKSGVRVQWDNGIETVVASRTIQQPWADFVAWRTEWEKEEESRIVQNTYEAETIRKAFATAGYTDVSVDEARRYIKTTRRALLALAEYINTTHNKENDRWPA